MQLPFTADQFFDVFRRYNEAVWPAQLLLAALALIAILASVRGTLREARAVSAILAALWLWMAIAYHFAFFSTINRAAILFGALFLLQGLLFLVLGVWKRKLVFSARWDAPGVLGGLLSLYALAVYPWLGSVSGHWYPALPTFGLPCPTAIFTLALLLWLRPPVPRIVFVIPLLWAAIATTAALQLGVREDLGLSVAGVVAAGFVLTRHGPRPETFAAGIERPTLGAPT
jgi:hypothetical protein